MIGDLQRSKRALVTLLSTLARVYNLVLPLDRDASDQEVTSAFRRVSRRAHPDKGGRANDQQQLNAAKDAWDHQRTVSAPRQAASRPSPPVSSQVVARRSTTQAKKGPRVSLPIVVRRCTAKPKREFRVHSQAVLLTYQGWTGGVAQWLRFNKFVVSKLKAWGVKYWSSTLETNDNKSHHAHVMLQFYQIADKSSKAFAFENIIPNCASNDLLGNGIGGRNYQKSINRGMFYVFADKIGTVRDATGRICVAGNYAPCWGEQKFKYTVPGRWPQDLWQARKLTHAVYEGYIYDTRDGVVTRKRNLDAVRSREEEAQARAEIESRTKRIRSNPALYQPFKPVPQGQAWLKLFQHDALRYPVMCALGPSGAGKTEWCASLFESPLILKVGTLTHFPDGIRALDRSVHDGLVLDDVRDLEFLSAHQEKLQGKYNSMVEFASTPGGTCAHCKDMFWVPIAITVNYSTKNLQYLEEHDWVSRKENVHVVTFNGRPGE